MLCCKACKLEGKHRGHNVLTLEDSKDFIKATLKTSIETLEKDTHILEDINKEAGEEAERTQLMKEQAKECVHKQFSELRKLIVEKENAMMSEIENVQMESGIDSLASVLHGILGTLSSILTEGKTLLNGWNSTTTIRAATMLTSIIKEVEKVKNTKNAYNETNRYEFFANLSDFEKGTKAICQSIETLNGVEFKKTPYTPKCLRARNMGYFFVALEWSGGKLIDKDDKYIVAVQKEGTMWDPNSLLECSENRLTITTLETDSTYKFSVMVKRGTTMSKWSDALTIKIPPVNIDSISKSLKGECDDVEICIKSLEQMKELTKKGKSHFINKQF